MAVKIRMARFGRRHRPFFRINAVDSRTPRDGRILEKLGHYDPLEKTEEKQVVLNIERIKHWLDLGAVPSDSVSDILAKHGIKTKEAEKKRKRREKAKSIARAKGKLFDKAEKVAAEKAAEAVEAEKKAVAEKVEADKKAAEAAEKAAAAEKTDEATEESAS